MPAWRTVSQTHRWCRGPSRETRGWRRARQDCLHGLRAERSCSADTRPLERCIHARAGVVRRNARHPNNRRHSPARGPQRRCEIEADVLVDQSTRRLSGGTELRWSDGSRSVEDIAMAYAALSAGGRSPAETITNLVGLQARGRAAATLPRSAPESRKPWLMSRLG